MASPVNFQGYSGSLALRMASAKNAPTISETQMLLSMSLLLFPRESRGLANDSSTAPAQNSRRFDDYEPAESVPKLA